MLGATQCFKSHEFRVAAIPVRSLHRQDAKLPQEAMEPRKMPSTDLDLLCVFAPWR